MLIKPVLVKGLTLLFDLVIDEVLKETREERLDRKAEDMLLGDDDDLEV